MATAIKPSVPAAMTAQSRQELVAFTILCFAALWIPVSFLIFAGPATERFFERATGGLIPPIILLAFGAYSPSLVGLLLTAYWRGWAGLKEHVARMFRWRVGLGWWAIALLGLPAAFLLVLWLRHMMGGGPPPQLRLFYAALPLLLLHGFVFTDSGPLGEEIGLRGYALPRLLEGFSPFTASVLFGLVWGLWHLPAFFIPGQSHTELSFWIFLIAPVGVSLFMTWIHINTRGSGLLSGIIPHMMSNAIGTAGIAKIGHWDGTLSVMLAGAVAVALAGRRFFQLSSANVFLPKR